MKLKHASKACYGEMHDEETLLW